MMTYEVKNGSIVVTTDDKTVKQMLTSEGFKLQDDGTLVGKLTQFTSVFVQQLKCAFPD